MGRVGSGGLVSRDRQRRVSGLRGSDDGPRLSQFREEVVAEVCGPWTGEGVVCDVCSVRVM